MRGGGETQRTNTRRKKEGKKMEGETRMNSIFTHIFFANIISSLDECS